MTVRDLFHALDGEPWGHAVGDLKVWQALLAIVLLSAFSAYVKGLIKGIREERGQTQARQDRTTK